jgi:MerR family transcriptional regulator/heat shock protein HspR
VTGMPFPPGADEDTPVFVISVAAQLSGLHAQTLRGYDRMGLVSPGRTAGGGRRYSMRDTALLREVQRLSQEEGVNLAGVKRIIELERQVDELRARVAALREELVRTAAAIHASYRNELVPFNQQTALVVWKPRR